MDGTVGYSFEVNLTEKNVKVEVPDDEKLYIKGGYIWEDEKLIKVVVGDDVIFEVTPRSKAFGKIKPYARRKLERVTLKKYQGDYGIFYVANLKIEMTREEAGMKA